VDCLTKFKDGSGDYTSLAALLPDYLAYINAFNAKSTGIKSCSIFRQDMLIFSNSICFDFVEKNVIQSVWLSFLGPFVFIMSIAMCASIRCPLPQDEGGNMGPQNTYHEGNTQNLDKVAPSYDKPAGQYYPPMNDQNNTGGMRMENNAYNPNQNMGIDI